MYTIEHVHAHQDDHIQFANLTTAAKLNTICDSLAKEAVLRGSQGPWAATTGLPLEAAYMTVEDTKLSSGLGNPICFHIGEQITQELDITSGKMLEECFDTIDWPAYKLAISSKPTLYQIWASKQLTGTCAVGKNMKYIDLSRPHQCSNCG